MSGETTGQRDPYTGPPINRIMIARQPAATAFPERNGHAMSPAPGYSCETQAIRSPAPPVYLINTPFHSSRAGGGPNNRTRLTFVNNARPDQIPGATGARSRLTAKVA